MKTADLCRYYKRARHEVRAVDRVSLDIERGDLVAVVGASGSGKSTLLNLLAGLDRPTAGHIEVGGERLDSLSRRDLARYRARRVGMVFQSFNLLPHHTALQNVETALFFDGTPRGERRSRASEILTRLRLGDRLSHRPGDLSGGEQQRVAIARALVKKPDVLFADEPTGNLDEENSRAMVELLVGLNREGLTVLMVTHDVEMAGHAAKRIVRMHYGQVVADTSPVARGDGGAQAVPPGSRDVRPSTPGGEI
jgi:putative ABC transport system ATP-binding protein